jgi:two-component system response regulator AtoC
MGSGEPDDVPTDVAAALRRVTTYIVVLLDEQAVQVLPSSGTVTIGRSRNADIEIKHPSVSREHAVLDIDALVLTDLGSRNGTLVAGQRIAAKTPVGVVAGEPIVIGDVTMYVQQDTSSSESSGSVHDEPLELRLADETARAARHGATFVHARVHVDDPARADAARELLIEGLRSSDVMSEDAPGNFQLLLPELTADRGRAVVQRLVATLAHGGIAARAGVACYPHDGVTAAQLSARARELIAAPSDEPTTMDDVLRMTASVANSEITVLVTGETGVGKELIAEMIHRISPRSRGPFMRINCAAIPEQLLESELFGHARGAFTGAETARVGRFEAAAGGTVFLDEIGEMALRTQASLLRVLEERAVRPVGESHARPIDVRIVCATNRPLDDALDGFRRDLYYRISGVTIAIPPLRERPHAIEAIARAFAALASARTRRSPPAFTDDALETLRTSAWPGNIRELRNAIERAVLLAGTGPIRRAELGLDQARLSAPTSLTQITRDTPTEPPPIVSHAPADPRALASEIEELERKRIVETLERFGGNQTRAARALGLSRTTLVARMETYALRRPRKGD